MNNDLICPYLKVIQTQIKTGEIITTECYLPCYMGKCPFFDGITGECKKAKKEVKQ